MEKLASRRSLASRWVQGLVPQTSDAEPRTRGQSHPWKICGKYGEIIGNLWEIWQNHEESLVNTVFQEDVRALKPWDWCKGVRVMVDLLEALAWENGTKNNGAGDLSCSGWDRGRKRPWSYAAIRNLKPAYPSDPLFGHPPTHQEWLHP